MAYSFKNRLFSHVFGALLASCLVSSALLACSGGDGTDATSTSASASASSGSGGAGGGGSGGAGGGGSGGVCPAGTICLDVHLLEMPVGAGRVGVAWFQLNDDGPDPVPVVGYDAAFDPASKRIEIPIASISEPNEENLLCERMCSDESICPCLSDPKIGLAYVIVAGDANGNGKLDADEFGKAGSSPAGFGYMALGFSAIEYPTAPAPYDQLFPEGIEKGVRPYRIVPGTMTFDKLGKSKDGDVFELNVCPNADMTTCKLIIPNLT